MSISLMTMVWQRLNVVDELALSLALADVADDDGTHIYPSVQRLQHKIRAGRRTVQRQLRYLEEITWLWPVEDGGIVGGRGKATEYRINPNWIKGAILAPLPDLAPYMPSRRKSAISDAKGRQQRQETASPTTPHSSGSVITHHSSFDDGVTERMAKRRWHSNMSGLILKKVQR